MKINEKEFYEELLTYYPGVKTNSEELSDRFFTVAAEMAALAIKLYNDRLDAEKSTMP